MRIFFILIFVFLGLVSCDESNAYTSAAEKLKKEFGVKLQVRDSVVGFAVYKNDEQRDLGTQVDGIFEQLKKSKEIVSVYVVNPSKIMEGGKVLKVLTEEKVKIYVDAVSLIWGISPGKAIYVSKNDKENADKLVKRVLSE